MSGVSGRTADVIVIGGGIHGCSTALHCAKRGLDVLLLEKDHVGRHASGVNAGGVRQLARDVAEVPLSVYSMDLWHAIGDLVDDDCGFTRSGQVLVAETADEFATCRRRVAELEALGYAHEELVDAAALRRLVPAVADTCPGGIVSRADGAAIPFRTVEAFRRKAVALGARVVEGVTVRALEREGALWRVVTDGARYAAPRIVNAAGAWADRLAAGLGEPVPLEVIAPMLMVTARLPPFIEPVVILRGRKLSFKQYANGTVLIGGGHLGRALRDGNATVLDWTRLAESARTVRELFAPMRDAAVVRAWAGIEARMPDGVPVFGPSARHAGVFHQFGFSAHGFQLGPGAGAVMAELVATGATNMPIEAFRIDRFARGGTTGGARAAPA